MIVRVEEGDERKAMGVKSDGEVSASRKHGSAAEEKSRDGVVEKVEVELVVHGELAADKKGSLESEDMGEIVSGEQRAMGIVGDAGGLAKRRL